MPANGAPKVEAIDRALVLLVALADAGPQGASLAALAERAGMPKATAYRALSTLRLRGFADQALDSSDYLLGPAAIDLADRNFGTQNLAHAIHPALVALSHAAGELVHLGVLAGDSVRYLDKVEPERAIRVWSAVGQQVPVASSALGRALLAARGVPLEHLGSYLTGLGDRKVTLDRLREAVDSARRLGFAMELGENEPDVACVGVAILRGSHPIAALSVTAPADRMTPERRFELFELIRSIVPPLLPGGLSLMPGSTSDDPGVVSA
ncbi:MAG: IclR family transcriptional regulator [Propionibacteriaceae bacterium]|nr:IclR family transcriptional regulator [Propionibacteriaceae bacterium]